MVGRENQFVNLLRQVRSDPGTAAAHELLQLRGRLGKSASRDVLDALQSASDAFAMNDLAGGVTLLATCLKTLPPAAYFDAIAHQLLQQCANDLVEYGPERVELLVLVLHVLHVGIRK
jgi:hypothetical protein